MLKLEHYTFNSVNLSVMGMRIIQLALFLNLKFSRHDCEDVTSWSLVYFSEKYAASVFRAILQHKETETECSSETSTRLQVVRSHKTVIFRLMFVSANINILLHL
jgi:hypothetical protein